MGLRWDERVCIWRLWETGKGVGWFSLEFFYDLGWEIGWEILI